MRNFQLFQLIGERIDLLIKWLFTFQGNNIQILFWTGLVGAILVFVIEGLRKPSIKICFLEGSFEFNLPKKEGECIKYINSRNWKFKVIYKSSFINKLLFKYPLTNLKIKIFIYDHTLRLKKSFQAKPDFNPNVYEEKDVPFALMGVNLISGEEERFPFINKSEDGWMFFDVWEVFLPTNNRREFFEKGTYYIKIKLLSDQLQRVDWAKFVLSEDDLKFQKINRWEKFKLKFY